MGESRLARPRQAGKPHAARSLVFEAGACSLVHIHVLPVDVARTPKGKFQSACGHCAVGLAVDQDEGTQIVVVLILLEGDRLIQIQVDPGHLIELEVFCSQFVRSEEHTSELQSLMRISYAVFCLKTKKNKT